MVNLPRFFIFINYFLTNVTCCLTSVFVRIIKNTSFWFDFTNRIIIFDSTDAGVVFDASKEICTKIFVVIYRMITF